MKRTIILGTVAILALGGIVFLIERKRPVESQRVRHIPDIVVSDYDGKEIKLSELHRKVLINVWASWCPFCKDEFQAFEKVKSQVGDAVTIIAINRAESLATAKKYSDELHTPSIMYVLDAEDSFYGAIGGFSMPETLFVDENGIILDHRRGPMNADEMERRIKQAFHL